MKLWIHFSSTLRDTVRNKKFYLHYFFDPQKSFLRIFFNVFETLENTKYLFFMKLRLALTPKPVMVGTFAPAFRLLYGILYNIDISPITGNLIGSIQA